MALAGGASTAAAAEANPAGMMLSRERNLLTITGGPLPGPITINYIEAYCRPGSTKRDWRTETVIEHQSTLISANPNGAEIKLRDILADGVVVDHTITARADEVDFRLVAHNPTPQASLAHWAQPCVRIDRFTGGNPADKVSLVPPYTRQCFLFIAGQLTRLPTEPWATAARYTPGQVYCPAHVDRDDVNPRPLSPLVPSSGLCGAFSADGSQILAMAWEPYQEIFQGVITCLHNDFRIGGLKAGETKLIRGKIYVVPRDEKKLLERFERDFPEQAVKSGTNPRRS
ncbi:MAG: hypothetical protein EXS37_11755 [Opitutus sp.]|nr:hypothetical protein [Opitutus sp.]